jgi:hypothetical protein
MDSACKPEYRARDPGKRESERQIRTSPSSRCYRVSNGRSARNPVPSSGTLTVIRPPRSRMRSWLIDKPSPVPDRAAWW